jgi:hypothetical protein
MRRGDAAGPDGAFGDDFEAGQFRRRAVMFPANDAGDRSPFFMPVPANIQWSGFVQIQSPPPLNGMIVRAPMMRLSSGPMRFHSLVMIFSAFAISSSVSPEKWPTRVMIRLGRPS